MSARLLRTTLILNCAALLASGAAGCSRATPAAAPATADRATFRGVYEGGSGLSAFLPCGIAERWYVSPHSAPSRELWRLTNTKDLQQPGGGMFPPERLPSIRRAYAEVQGYTIAVNSGRLATAYERELRVTRVLIVRPAQGGLCP